MSDEQNQNLNPGQNIETTNAKKRNKGGHPKGLKNKIGLDLNKRIKVLQKIILDKTQDTNDRLQAIKLMTDLLADKVRVEDSKETLVTQIKFEEKPVKKSDNIEKQVEKTEEKPMNTTTITTTTITDTTTTPKSQVVDNQQLTNNITFKFEIEKDDQ